ncbi:MAG: two component signal transduction system response regulator [Bacteroidetes bacterium HLUCCA01]|nr:MAG: two component signal transduction system response regulator [Bacteroidetes bacterium HLUCCA01]
MFLLHYLYLADYSMHNILIVEDEFIIAMLIEKQVRKLGYMVVGKVANGEGAIQRVKDGGVDLVLMDIKINGDLDGIQTMHEIQRFSTVPVIYITGNSDPATRERAMATNPSGYIIKPIETEALRVEIEAALGTST